MDDIYRPRAMIVNGDRIRLKKMKHKQMRCGRLPKSRVSVKPLTWNDYGLVDVINIFFSISYLYMKRIFIVFYDCFVYH